MNLNLEKEYYSAKEVTKIIGCCQSKAYDLIASLNKQLKKEYPEKYIIDRKIPIWFFDLKIRKGSCYEK